MIRGSEKTWRKAKLTPKFIQARAIALSALRRGSKPVQDTQWVLKNCKTVMTYCDVYISERMFREALDELQEQGFIDAVGCQYQYYWYSNERLV